VDARAGNEGTEGKRAEGSSNSCAARPSSRPPFGGWQRVVSGEVRLVLFLTFALLLGQKLFEHNNFAQWGEMATFAYLERLLPDTAEERLPVVVVDIRRLSPGLGGTRITPRDKLQDIIQALSDAKAAAIGVDIDFSPDEKGYVDPKKDPAFFEFCRRIRTGTPIFLGVYRARYAEPDGWLGEKANLSLAASIEAATTERENPDDERTLARIPRQFASGGAASLQAMGYALSEAYFRGKNHRRPTVPFWWPALLEDRTPTIGNYSKLGQIRRERSLAWTAPSIADTSEDFTDKIVLLGDIEDADRVADDYFRPPLSRPQAGVLYHASAFYTFAIEPLYEFKWWVRLILDCFGAVPFIVAIWVKDKWAPSEEVHRARRMWIERGALTAALMFLLVLGSVWLLKFRIMWLEALIGGAALILHVYLAPKVKWAYEKLQAIVRAYRAGAKS
jgi:hypothetical protein